MFVAGLVLAGCVPTGSMQNSESAPEDRLYGSTYKRAIETVARTAQDVGLTLENTSAQADSSYFIKAVRMRRVPGASEPLPVVTVRIHVDRLQGEDVRVRVEQREVKGVSAAGAGNSSIRRDYRQILFRKLDERLQKSTGQPSRSEKVR